MYWTQKTDGKKEIDITALENDSQALRILISDTGPGISEEDAIKIFQPGITAKPYGIGMAISSPAS